MKTEFSNLIGKTLVKIENRDNKELLFHTSDNEIYRMFHEQDCCECVDLEDIIGNLDDILNSPIMDAFEKTDDFTGNPKYDEYNELTQWTFYTIVTEKSSVTLRWYGESNGYYSVNVDFELLDN